MRFILLLSFIFSLACSENGTEILPQTTSFETTEHRIVDPGGDNWIAVGGSFVDLLGKDGEPNEVPGRIVFNGNDILKSVSGHDKWVVFGAGKLQSLDHSGQRINDVRDALNGNAVHSAAMYPDGWLIAGQNGAVQKLDSSGEPTRVESTIFDGDTVSGLAYSGVAWLGISESGKILTFNSDLSRSDVSGTAVLTKGVGVVSNSEPSSGSRWFIFSESHYAAVGASGVAGTLIPLPAQNITTVHESENAVFIGTASGEIFRSDYGNSLNFSKVATMKTGVRSFVSNGHGKTLALAQQSVISLNTSDGSESSAETDQQNTFVSAHFSITHSEWILVYKDNGLIRFLASDLRPKKPNNALLDGENVNAAAKGTEGVLIVGDAGMIQLVEDDGTTISTPTQIDGSIDLLDVEWNGKTFLVVGRNGFSQIVSASGTLEEESILLDGGDIQFASWSGSFYLIGGESRFQIIRPTGVALGATKEIPEVNLMSAGFDGERWMAVGNGTVGGIAVFINEENNDAPSLINVSIAVLKGVDFDGLEWLVGGSEGFIQRISASGQKIGGPVSALDGLDLETIFFNGSQYMVGGERGAVRRIGSDFTPIRTTISITNSQTVNDLLWSKPRGFSNGPCITNDACFAGPCVGGLGAGKCCDSACDRPCESCFQRDTGEDDGTCAPVVVGKQSPKSGAQGCLPQPESSCGQTGFCDGAGECAFHQDDIQCAPASCANDYAAAGTCDGTGACSMPASESCAPYVGCDLDSGCQTSCATNADCLTGFECDASQCLEIKEVLTPTTGNDDVVTQPDEGCSTISNNPSATFIFALLGFLIFGFRRKN